MSTATCAHITARPAFHQESVTYHSVRFNRARIRFEVEERKVWIWAEDLCVALESTDPDRFEALVSQVPADQIKIRRTGGAPMVTLAGAIDLSRACERFKRKATGSDHGRFLVWLGFNIGIAAMAA